MTIAALVSGGVDSAVSVHLLKERGYDPHLFYIKIGPERDKDWNCTSEEDLEICQWLARHYGLRLDVVDLHREYWEQVVGYTMDKARQGLTPNPDVMCNRLIKFGCFEQQVGHEFDRTATGHYAQTELDECGRTWLATSPDPVKDQTDFLCYLDYAQVRKSCFPIGHLLKHEVRTLAEKAGLLNAKRRDSQGICFLGDIDFREYIRRNLGENPGDVREFETGRKIGTHHGLWFYTIGQRKGLGFSGGPWFVVKKNLKRNILFVSHGYDPDEVYKDRFSLTAFHFITANPWLTADESDGHRDSVAAPIAPRPITFKIRHTPECLTGQIERDAEGVWHVRSDQRIHGVAPGQFCVVYDGQHRRCYGSGEICL